MKFNPHFTFNGNCEEAFSLYAKVFGAAPPTFFRFAGSPMAGQVSADWANKVMHVTMSIGDQILMGADAPPPHFRQPQGFASILIRAAKRKPSASIGRFRQAGRSGCRYRRLSGQNATRSSSTGLALRG